MNLTVQYKSPEDGQWGGLKVNRATNETYWSGMVGELAYDRADVCTAFVGETKTRKKVLDFSVGFAADATTITVSADGGSSKASVDAKVFLLVFTLGPWLALATAFPLITICSAALSLTANEQEKGPSTLSCALGEGMTKLFLAVLQRGPEADGITSVSSKILFITVHSFGFIIFVYYTGDLTATMTSGNRLPPITTFEDVMNFDYSVMVTAGTQGEAWLKRAPPSSAMDKVARTRMISVSVAGQEGIEGQKRRMEEDRKLLLWDSALTFALDNR